MRVTLTKSNVAEHVYISKAYRNDKGKSTSRIFKKLGTMAELLPKHDNDREKVLAWAREQARICTEEEKNNTLKVPVERLFQRRIFVPAEDVPQTWAW